MSSKLDYLKRYLDGGGGDADAAAAGGGEKKKKRRKKDKPAGGLEIRAPDVGGVVVAKPVKVCSGIRVVDEDDESWKRKRDELEEARRREDETPTIVGGGDGDGAKTTNATRKYLGIREDGSGWAVVAEDDDATRANANAGGGRGGGGGGGGDDDDDDLSPPRPGRHDSDDDDDLSPPRPGRRHDSDDDDLSPPRPGRRHDSDDDQSPPRRRPGARRGGDDGGDGDLSPPRRGRGGSDGDLSPPRRRRRRGGESDSDSDSDADLSPPRRAPKPPSSGPTMTDGTTTGLVDAAVVVQEAAEKRAVARARITAMSDDVSGRGAATQFRDKATGQLIDLEEQKKRMELANARRKEPERPVWTQGIAQGRAASDAAEALRREADAPFARADIAPEAEDAQRAAVRFGDPMAHLARKKQQNAEISMPSVVAGISEEQLKKSGFRIPQEVPEHSWIRRGVGPPLNRYGIKPGRHWDGVDRSTGFEQEMFKAKNDRRSRDQSAWKYVQQVWE